MTQSRTDSFMEAVVNVIIGLLVSTVANWIILPALLGVQLTLATNLMIGVFYTIVSILRSFAIRRLFNGRSPWRWCVWQLQRRGQLP